MLSCLSYMDSPSQGRQHWFLTIKKTKKLQLCIAFFFHSAGFGLIFFFLDLSPKYFSYIIVFWGLSSTDNSFLLGYFQFLFYQSVWNVNQTNWLRSYGLFNWLTFLKVSGKLSIFVIFLMKELIEPSSFGDCLDKMVLFLALKFQVDLGVWSVMFAVVWFLVRTGVVLVSWIGQHLHRSRYLVWEWRLQYNDFL